MSHSSEGGPDVRSRSPHCATASGQRGVQEAPSRPPGVREGTGRAEGPTLPVRRSAVAGQRGEEAEADGQGSDGDYHPPGQPDPLLPGPGLIPPPGAAHPVGTRPPRGESPLKGLSHLTPEGEARMVDVTAKAESAREAVARVVLRMKRSTLAAIKAGQLAKGDVLGVARTAGVLAAKRTSDLIPLCHPLRITGVEVTFQLNENASTLGIEARVRTVEKTGGKSGVWRRRRR